MKKDHYVYPAVFDYAGDGISIFFPDLPGCLPCARTTEEAIHNAKEAMALHLYNMEQDGDPIPEPTPVDKLKLKPNQIPFLVEVYMPMYREAIENNYVRKNVTLPAWLERMAAARGMNFSQILQSALKERLGIIEKQP
ncbi:MAG TPA: type II toxin-antitoxin system HicB family antitoxin [Firmicutes bacterium]|nr:type II toxin-antitoxin system HicB family antitoxin [Bacillota bacterium]